MAIRSRPAKAALQMELTELYRALYGERTRSRNGEHLRKRLSWRVQELAEGGLAPQMLSKIVELGDGLPERWHRRLEPQNPARSLRRLFAPHRSMALPGHGWRLRVVTDALRFQVFALYLSLFHRLLQ